MSGRLPVSAARAYAALGNGDRAVAAIRAARTPKTPSSPTPSTSWGGICLFNQARTLYYGADALSWLPGQADEAVAFSGRAVAAYEDRSDPSWAFGDEGGSRADLPMAGVALEPEWSAMQR